jgi:hypothetical protein
MTPPADTDGGHRGPAPEENYYEKFERQKSKET